MGTFNIQFDDKGEPVLLENEDDASADEVTVDSVSIEMPAITDEQIEAARNEITFDEDE